MKNTARILIFIIPLFLIIGCGNKTVFEKNIKFGNEGWNRFTKLSFDFEINNPDIRYDIFIEVKIKEDYPEQFIPLYLKADYSNGETRSDKYSVKIKDNYNRFLKEPKDGLRQYSDCIQKGKKFPKAGKYQYEFEQGTSRLVIKGIEEINFKIMKSKITD